MKSQKVTLAVNFNTHLLAYERHDPNSCKNMLSRQTLAGDPISKSFCTICSRLTQVTHEERDIGPEKGKGNLILDQSWHEANSPFPFFSLKKSPHHNFFKTAVSQQYQKESTSKLPSACLLLFRHYLKTSHCHSWLNRIHYHHSCLPFIS